MWQELWGAQAMAFTLAWWRCNSTIGSCSPTPDPHLMLAKAVTCKITTTRSPKMNPRIWGQLPEDLLERILALLPLKTLLNLRPTCKHFNSLLFSPSFLSFTKTPLLSSFLLSHPQSQPRFPLYDAFLDS
ncbi:hypothetical protein MRB53_024401 [Persea americana]|uniref:Uncharacterized protein n=1 Tax=Persea americana TaxID=3435 RepID=A0ACC2LDB7_PERAE|nr:hypothetical protein MRB53_024401 [Persea americana]